MLSTTGKQTILRLAGQTVSHFYLGSRGSESGSTCGLKLYLCARSRNATMWCAPCHLVFQASLEGGYDSYDAGTETLP